MQATSIRESFSKRQAIDQSAQSCEVIAEAYLHSFLEEDNFAHMRAVTYVAVLKSAGWQENANDIITNNVGGDVIALPTIDTFSFSAKYFGPETESQATRLYRIFRSSSILSIVCAVFVIADKCCQPSQACKYLHNQIMVVMADFDIILCNVASGLVDIPMPTSDVLATHSQKGNYVTCQAQGWLFIHSRVD